MKGEEITWMFDARLPGQRVMIDADGQIVFLAVESGVSPRGVPWVNTHLLHRENAAPYMRDRALPWLVGKGLDVGCGLEKIVPDCVGIDNGDDFDRSRSDADDLRDGSDLTGYLDGSFDWLYSCNALEHIENWRQALSEWVRVTRRGGVLFLSMPWPAMCYLHGVGVTPAHRWNPTPEAVGEALVGLDVDVVEQDDVVDRWGCFCVIGRRRDG